MLLHTETRASSSQPQHVRVGTRPDVLGDIRDPGVNLAIWRRTSNRAVLDDVALEEIDDLAVDRSSEGLADVLPGDLVAAGYPTGVAQILGREVAAMAREFAAIVAAPRVSIRVDVVEGDACRRFHADYVTARLICTLVGPGTQWLDAADAAALARGEAVERLIVRSIATGDVALFKGRLWSPDAPIVHRSPPVAATGKRRLLLVIDPAADAAPPHA